MPLLSDYLNFNGTPGTQGPQGPQGYQGEMAISVVFKGVDSWTNVVAIPAPEVGDGWFLNDPTGAPDSAEGPAQIGDLVIWNGTSWTNAGQVEGPEGTQGPQGDQGYGVAIKGTATWAYVADLTAQQLNDIWLLVDADPNAPPIDDPDIGPLRPAQIGDGVVWTGTDWENMGPIAGPQGFQGDTGATGPQGFQGEASTVAGPQGTQGFQGDDGDPAQSIIIKGNDTWANISALPSPVQNEAWGLTEATGAPPSSYGPAAIGDIVVYDGTSAWVNIGPLQGPQGEDGAQGTTGAAGGTGPQGDDGPAGPQGDDGTDGAQGADGDDGADGTTGPQGPIGSTGPAGPQGPTGFTGPQGFKGEEGDEGDRGPQGYQGTPGVVGGQGPQGDDGDDGSIGPQGPQGEPGTEVPITGGTESLSISGVGTTGTISRVTVGALVILSGRLDITSAGSTGNAVISGLAYPCVFPTGVTMSTSGINLGGSVPSERTIVGRLEAGSSSITLLKWGSEGDEGPLENNKLSAGDHIDINLSYYASGLAGFD